MKFGRKLTIYLADGSPAGIRHVEIANWSGQAISCPRSRLGELKKWEEATRPGVYFLFEKQSIGTSNKAYIGESENIVKRLSDHDRKKEFWGEVVLFTSKDENLTKSHVKYLESRLVSLSLEADRYQLENNNTPTESSLPRSDKDSMEEFIYNLKIVLGTLGHKILDNITAITEVETEETSTITSIPLFFTIKDLKATGQQSDEGFILFKGSLASSTTSNSMPGNSKIIRNNWIEDGTLIKENDHFILTKDCIVSSSSYAAVIVAGTSRSGPQSWLDKQGRTLKSIEEQILKST